jgi:type I restriction enzyme S subunit
MREQSEIGKLFDTLDETIALHQRKYENLQAVKKELLKRMFASDKKPVPDFRFNGYTNDWEQRKLGDIAKFYSGGTPAVGNAGYYNGGIPFIRSAELSSETTELTITESGLKNSSAKLVNKGNLLYAMYGATSGEVGRAGVNGAINQAILAILPNVGYEVSFVQQWLIHSKNSIVGTYLQGGQGNLSSSIIKKLSMSVPSRREQEKISTLLSTIDGALALHQRKLEDLKQLKKVLLQKLFV